MSAAVECFILRASTLPPTVPPLSASEYALLLVHCTLIWLLPGTGAVNNPCAGNTRLVAEMVQFFCTSALTVNGICKVREGELSGQFRSSPMSGKVCTSTLACVVVA